MIGTRGVKLIHASGSRSLFLARATSNEGREVSACRWSAPWTEHPP
jgi:hypothetical protein